MFFPRIGVVQIAVDIGGSGVIAIRQLGDATGTWRLIYRIDPDAIVIVEVFEKKTPETPRRVIEPCQQRLRRYDMLAT